MVVSLKGIELKKVFGKFTADENQPYANAKVLYQGGRVAALTVNGEPIDNEKIYRIATLNFIAEGGDNILTGIRFDDIFYTNQIFRDVVINYLKEKKVVTQRLDDRVKNE